MRLLQPENPDAPLQVQYYMPKDPSAVCGAASNPSLLKTLTAEQFELLPGCLLNVSDRQINPNSYHFTATIPSDARCCFTYQGKTQQVFLGFEATEAEFF